MTKTMNKNTKTTKTLNYEQLSHLFKSKKCSKHISKIDEQIAMAERFLKERKAKRERMYRERVNHDSYVVPSIVENAECPSHRGRKPIMAMWRGKVRPLRDICVQDFNLDWHLVHQRIFVGKWDMVRAFGVENHATDNWIEENLELMRK